MSQLNQALLLKIGTRTETAKLISMELAGRERPREESDITRMRRDFKKANVAFSQEDMYKFWHELADNDIGVIIPGRRDIPDRFKWNYNLTIVAKGLTGAEMPKVADPTFFAISRVQNSAEEAVELLKKRNKMYEPADKVAKKVAKHPTDYVSNKNFVERQRAKVEAIKNSKKSVEVPKQVVAKVSPVSWPSLMEKPKTTGSAIRERVLSIELRPNFDLDIRLPQDLTREEAEKLFRAISRVISA